MAATLKGRLLRLLDGEVTARQVAGALGCSKTHANRMLAELVETRHVARIGSGTNCVYRKMELQE